MVPCINDLYTYIVTHTHIYLSQNIGNLMANFCYFSSSGIIGLIYASLYTYTGKGNGNPLQHSCLDNPMDREAWRATVHGVAKSRT